MKTPLPLRALLSSVFVFVSATTVRADVKARGSDSTLHVLKTLVTAFEAETGKKVSLEGGGSGLGVKGLLAGEVTLAFLSRELKDTEKSAGLVGRAYAKDGVAVIVHQSNTTTNLTTAQLKGFFTAQTTTWPDGRTVVAFNRNADSGTREVFQEEVLGKETFSPKAAVKHDGVLIASVEKIPTSVAYTSLGEIDEAKIKVVSVNGIRPSAGTLKDGSYPLSRTPTLATKGEPTGDEKAFIDFVLGPKGQALVEKCGMVRIQ